MEFAEPMKEILRTYQILNQDLQSGLLVIIFKSLPRELQQDILLKLFQYETNQYQDGLCKYLHPSFLLKAIEASQELQCHRMKNALQQLVDLILQDFINTDKEFMVLLDKLSNIAVSKISLDSDINIEDDDESIQVTDKEYSVETFPEDDSNAEFKKFLCNYKEQVPLVEPKLKKRCVQNDNNDSEEKEKSVKVSSEKTCHKCNHVFSSNYSLKRHLQLHESYDGVFCNFCKRNNRFKTMQLMLHHKQTHHPDISQCRFCSMSFVDEVTMKKHEAVHTKPPREFKCGFCGDLFTSVSNAKYHIRKRHTWEKPYVCKFCPMRYFDLTSLQRHRKKMHAGENEKITPQIVEDEYKNSGKLQKDELHKERLEINEHIIVVEGNEDQVNQAEKKLSYNESDQVITIECYTDTIQGEGHSLEVSKGHNVKDMSHKEMEICEKESNSESNLNETDFTKIV